MPRKLRRPVFIGINTHKLTKAQKVFAKTSLICLMVLVITLPISLYLRALSSEFAAAEARSTILYKVNDIIRQKMSDGGYDYNYFVQLEKDEYGSITALTTNMARINELSSEITQDVVTLAGSGDLNLRIPMGNMFGSNLLSGRGPKMPVRVVMLTTSNAEFRNELVSAGINQTKHQIILTVTVDTNVLIPWGNIRDSVTTDILVAETVIVGKVPDSYITLE